MADRIVSEASVKRYVLYASERCVQESLLASGNDKSDGWKQLKARRGVEISRKSQGPQTVVRGRKVANVSPFKVEQLANTIHISKQWDPNLLEGCCLQTLQGNLVILRLAFSGDAGPLLKNRVIIVYERRETMDDGTLVVAIASLPHEMAAAISPQSGKLFRGLLQSGWVIEHLEQNDECKVTCTAQIDPGGWLPKWLVNILSVNLVMIVDNLCKDAIKLF